MHHMLSRCLVAGLLLAGFALPVLAASEEQGEDEAYEQAAIDFLSYCAPCHGRDGTGKGPVAMELKTKPADLTTIAKRNGGVFPQDKVRQTIDGRGLPTAHGTADMPVWGYWFKLQANAAGILQEDQVSAEAEVKERVDRLVDYLATLQK
jgi:mono/diheme cytochrome c family protein